MTDTPHHQAPHWPNKFGNDGPAQQVDTTPPPPPPPKSLPEWLTDVERLAKNIYYTTGPDDALNWQRASAPAHRKCTEMARKIVAALDGAECRAGEHLHIYPPDEPGDVVIVQRHSDDHRVRQTYQPGIDGWEIPVAALDGAE